MGYLLPALTDAKFENQRDVVLNERRQNYENRPYGLAGMAIVAALYPPDHPVSLADDRRRRGHLARPRIDDVRAFFQTYYQPAQRVAVAGWRHRRRTRRCALAEDYFGELEAGEEPPPVACTRSDARRSESRMRAGGSRRAAAALPRLALAGDVRGRRRGARSRRRRARQRQDVAPLPQRSSTSSVSPPRSPRRRIRARSAAFSRSSRPRRRGARCSELERAITEEIDRFVSGGPTAAEMERVPRAGRGAVRLSPADRRRVRRQGRSAERLQRVPRRARLLRSRPRTLP